MFRFNVIRLGLNCEACVALEINCVHKKTKLPPWRPEYRNDLVQALMGNSTIANREMGGQVQGHGQRVFKEKWIKALIDKIMWQPMYPVQVIHTAIDPAGGGESSDWAICSVVFENGHVIVSHSSL